MKSKASILLEKTTIFRWLFFATIPIYLFADQYIQQRDITFGVNLIFLFLSALSFRKILIQAITSGVISIVGELHVSHFHIHMFIFHWFSSFACAAFIVTLLEKYLVEKRNILDLINSLAKSLDSRDTYTASHSQNVASYSKRIAMEMKLPYRICENLYYGGLLHDIGKIGVPEAILNKPSRLTDQEYLLIKKHPLTGFHLVKHIERFKQSGILNMILYHHERYDGKGYPHGLKGNDIPLEARIMAVADAFDAMTSKRVYRNQADWGTVLDELHHNKEKQFDPLVVDAFLKILKHDNNFKQQHKQVRNPYNFDSSFLLN